MLRPAMDCDNAGPTPWNIPPWDRDSADWLSIDRRLPPDHPARLIDDIVVELDLTELHRSYAGRGSSPHSPGLLLRLILFESWKGEPSPSQWHDDCQESDPAKWLLFGLQPSRSSLYAFRDRCGRILDGLNQQILQMAQAAGVVTGDDVAIDGTFVSSRGSRHRLVNLKTLNKRIEQLTAAVAADDAPADDDETSQVEGISAVLPRAEAAASGGTAASASTEASVAPAAGNFAAVVPPAEGAVPTSSSPPAPAEAPAAPCKEKSASWMAKTPATRRKQSMNYRRARKILERNQERYQRTLSRTTKAKRRAVERLTVCPTEPEAALGRDKLKTFRPLYNVQFARALDAPFIMGYDVVAETTDAGQFGPMVRRVQFLRGHLPKRVAVDEKYAGPVDLALARNLGIAVFAPTPETKKSEGSRKPPNKGMIPKQDFTWLPEGQTYRCPEGHFLKFVRSSTETRQGGETLKLTQYRCPAEHCQACPLKAQCTRNPELGRIVKRSEHDELVEGLRDQMRQPEAVEFYRLRKQTVELCNADGKEHRGLRQIHGFGLTRARAQVAMIVLVVNGRALVKARNQQQGGPAEQEEAAA